jgi:hypothetical protein
MKRDTCKHDKDPLSSWRMTRHVLTWSIGFVQSWTSGWMTSSPKYPPHTPHTHNECFSWGPLRHSTCHDLTTSSVTKRKGCQPHETQRLQGLLTNSMLLLMLKKHPKKKHQLRIGTDTAHLSEQNSSKAMDFLCILVVLRDHGSVMLPRCYWQLSDCSTEYSCYY